MSEKLITNTDAPHHAGSRDGEAPRPARKAAGTAELPLAKAINAGLRKALGDDSKVLLMGE